MKEWIKRAMARLRKGWAAFRDKWILESTRLRWPRCRDMVRLEVDHRVLYHGPVDCMPDNVRHHYTMLTAELRAAEAELKETFAAEFRKGAA